MKCKSPTYQIRDTRKRVGHLVCEKKKWYTGVQKKITQRQRYTQTPCLSVTRIKKTKGEEIKGWKFL